MAETEFEKWLAMKAGKRKKQTVRGNAKGLSTRKKKASVLKLAKQPTQDPKDSVKSQTVEDQLESAESITVSQDLSTLSQTETNSGTAPISVKNVTTKSRSRKRRRRSKKEDTSSS